MKIMIRTATGLLAASFVAASTNCAPNPVIVHDVYHYHHYDHNASGRNAPSYNGNAGAPPGRSAARAFEPVERF
jgi:hypothetical protein